MEGGILEGDVDRLSGEPARLGVYQDASKLVAATCQQLQ
jgi:hypothetical protein